jgi:hypothetical protein
MKQIRNGKLENWKIVEFWLDFGILSQKVCLCVDA